MKIRLLLALVGLAISFALPTFAQQTNPPDPQLRQALDAIKRETEASTERAAILAANFTEDGVLVTPDGRFSVGGHPKYYAERPVSEQNCN
jgi:hypothetical protein